MLVSVAFAHCTAYRNFEDLHEGNSGKTKETNQLFCHSASFYG